MKKLTTTGQKWLKTVHLIVLVLMLGGIISSLVLRLGLRLTDYSQVLFTYRLMLLVSDYVIRYGAKGILLTGIVYSVWTNWGFFRYRWVTVKWAVFLGQTVFGIACIDRWMVANLRLLEAGGPAALTDPVFVQQHAWMQWGAIAQVAAILFLTWVSVFKPWKQRAGPAWLASFQSEPDSPVSCGELRRARRQRISSYPIALTTVSASAVKTWLQRCSARQPCGSSFGAPVTAGEVNLTSMIVT